MNMKNEKLRSLIDDLTCLLPNSSFNYSLTVHDDESITMNITPDNKFSDSTTLEDVKAFKEKLKNLDNAIFNKAFTKLSQGYPTFLEFDSLLENASFNKEESKQVYEWMSIFSTIILDTIQDNIVELVDKYESFC